MKAIVVHEEGGPERLVLEDVAEPVAGPDELLVDVSVAGLNYIDTYHRSGLYPLPELPAILGREAAGVVDAIRAVHFNRLLDHRRELAVKGRVLLHLFLA